MEIHRWIVNKLKSRHLRIITDAQFYKYNNANNFTEIITLTAECPIGTCLKYLTVYSW